MPVETGIHITLMPFREPNIQRVARKACERFNHEQIKAVTGQVIQFAVLGCI